MQGKVQQGVKTSIPEEIITKHYCGRLPGNFTQNQILVAQSINCSPESSPTLMTAHLPEVLDWLHGMEIPRGLEENPCPIPVLLYDEELSAEHLLFHYDGTPASAGLIRNFITLFQDNIKQSKATIISPSFIPKSKQREEQELIQLVSNSTFETSFIKFNFTRIGDFWSYAVKHQCTLLVTTKEYQADLAKVLFHFYKGGIWYNRLSFYLSY
ncbi:hypothetical protein SAMN06295967_11283 [Belliella buryatensis]|uniref:Uncharacterized protein n=1 Tax=Belliella buryatensis TaxID=1500549 RepID=A0A239FF04_9BACT|nr:hypothetical protein [Belliella buryatensis]SNS55506.1 hypothetical protein SAMN06295967_11283 [Belliella buryatensis]